MQTTMIIFERSVEHLKEQARKHKRQNGISHTQALDEVAQKHGFQHWHHVTLCHAHVKPAEKALKEGYILAFDVKDGMDVDTSDGALVEDRFLFELCHPQMYERYKNTIFDDDPEQTPLRETMPEEEMRANFEEDFDYLFFRMHEKYNALDLKGITKIIRKYSFWQPEYIWLKGQMIDSYHMPAEDEDGNIVGIRL